CFLSRHLCELRVQRDTRIMTLLVSLWFGSSLRSTLRIQANFRTATLGGIRHAAALDHRYRGALLVPRRLDRLFGDAVSDRAPPPRPQFRDEQVSRRLDAADAPARDAHGRRPDRGGAAERHGVLRLDLADRDRRHADAAALVRR